MMEKASGQGHWWSRAAGWRLPVGRLVGLQLIIVGAIYAPPAAAGIDTWTSSGPLGAPVTALAVGVFGEVYAGVAGHGVSASFDHGLSWRDMSIGLRDTYVQSLVVDPAAATTLY